MSTSRHPADLKGIRFLKSLLGKKIRIFDIDGHEVASGLVSRVRIKNGSIHLDCSVSEMKTVVFSAKIEDIDVQNNGGGEFFLYDGSNHREVILSKEANRAANN